MSPVRRVTQRKQPVSDGDMGQHAVGASGGVMTVQPGITTTVQLVKEWDSDGYLDEANPECVQIPAGLGGQYLLTVAVRWIIDEHLLPVVASFEPESSSYFSCSVEINGQVLGNLARATTNRVTGAKGTSQHFTIELALQEHDSVTLHLWHCFSQRYIEQIDAMPFLQLRRLGPGL